MARTRRLISFVWSSATAFGDFTVAFPANELFRSLSAIANFTQYTYLSYDCIKLRFTPNTTKFFRGLLGVTFIPGGYDKANGTFYTPTALSGLPTTYVDASSLTSAEMTIPYTSFLPKVTPGDLATTLGHIVLWVLDPLACESAPGVTSSISINIEANFVNPQLHDPQFNGLTIPADKPRVSNVAAAGSFSFCQGPGTSPVAKEAEKKTEKGVVSRWLEATSHISAKASVLPVVGTFASGLSVVTGIGSKIADIFGLSKPITVADSTFVERNPSRNWMTFHGVGVSDVLSTDPLPYGTTESRYVASDKDDCDFSYLVTRPNLVSRFTTTNVPADTPILLGVVAVAPRYAWSMPGDVVVPSNLALRAEMAINWRGDIDFKFIIPATPMTRARLAFSFSLSKVATFSENSRYMYVEIEGTTVVTGTIPHTHTDLYRALPATSNGNQQIGTSANGYIHVWQVTNVAGSTPATVPAPLSILAFAAGTSHTQFASFKHPYYGLLTSRGPAFPNGFLGLDNTLTIERVMAEDSLRSAREALHRPVLMWETSVPLAGVSFKPSDFAMPQYVNFFLYLCRFWRGSVTYTFVASGSTLPDVACGIFSPDSKALTHWYPKLSPKFSISVPWVFGRGPGETGSLGTQRRPADVQITIPAFTGTAFSVATYINFNDDFAMGVAVPPTGIIAP